LIDKVMKQGQRKWSDNDGGIVQDRSDDEKKGRRCADNDVGSYLLPFNLAGAMLAA
jgi:hypothetical protein